MSPKPLSVRAVSVRDSAVSVLLTFTRFNMRLIALAAVLGGFIVRAGSWSTAAPIPERLQEHHGVLFGGKIYEAEARVYLGNPFSPNGAWPGA